MDKSRVIPFKWQMLVFIILLAALFVNPMPVSAQVVSPMQSGHYAPGVINVRDMGAPPPGFFLIWYNLWFNSDTYYDREGNEVTSLGGADLNLDISGFATVPALFFATETNFLGGASYLAGISPSYFNASGALQLDASGTLDTTISESGSVGGWSDLYVSPLGLAWSFDGFDLSFFYGFYAPVGRYETGADDNTGMGFWTHQFQTFGYYYPVPDQSTAIMLGLTYEVTTEIKDVEVNPGNRFTLEWGVSQYLSERLEVAVQGGFNWQVTDDSGNDVFWDSSYHDRKSIVGFSLGYWPVPNRLYLAGKYAFDFGNAQRFKTNYWMANFIFII